MNCFSHKIASKKQPYQAPASFSNFFRQQESLTTSVIINLGATDHFFTNKNSITNYKKHHHVFETGLGENVITYGNEDIILQPQLLDRTVNIPTVSNVS